jgi:hypothetical protein
MIGTEAGAHGLFDGRYATLQVGGSQQLQAQLVDFGGEHVVVASNADEVLELPLQFEFLLPQDRDLALYK